jgi:putative transcriptional regulator
LARLDDKVAKGSFERLFVIHNDIVKRGPAFASAFCYPENKYASEADVIKCHLSRLMGERKLKIVDVARATGLHRNTITLLYQETASRVDVEAMDKLCAFFSVGVGELFEHMPQPAKATVKGSLKSRPKA